jgi:hypothetical protein
MTVICSDYIASTGNIIVMYLIKALPGNGSVYNHNNTETVFYGVQAVTVAMQRWGKYASTTKEAVFWGVRAVAIYAEQIGTRSEWVGDSSEFSGRDSQVTFVFEEELTCEMKTLCVL